MYQIIHERPEDAALIEPLLDKCFGPERFEKTAYKIRENINQLPELSFIVRDNGNLLATIRYWPLLIGGNAAAILLGPIAVEPDRQGQKIGVTLIRKSLALAQVLGHEIVVLVGDPEYYEQFGFQNASALGLEFPGPVAERRFLVKELADGAINGVSGMVEGLNPASEPMSEAMKSKEVVAGLSTFSPPAEA